MKRWRHAFVALCFAVAAGCADDRAREADRPAEKEAGTPGAAGTTGTAEADREREAGFTDRNFVRDRISAGRTEMELAKLAQEKTRNNRVKEFAAMMVRDHQKADAELKTVARDANIDLSDMDREADDAKDAREKFAKLSGAEFDREFMDRMVNDHEKAVNDVEDKAEGSDNQHIKQWASKTLPTLRKHLEQARQIHEGLQKRSGT